MRKKSKKRPLQVGSQRSIGGLKEMELARMAGVSRSTVQRWKRGTSNNEKLMKTLQGVLEEQLRDKIKTIKDYHKENDLPTSHFERVGELLLGELEKSYGASELAISKLEKVLSSKTSTVYGEEDWRRNVRSAAERTFGLVGDELDDALDVFNDIEKNATIRDYLEREYGLNNIYDSKQRVKLISIIDISITGDIKGFYEVLKRDAVEWKKKERKRQDDVIW